MSIRELRAELAPVLALVRQMNEARDSMDKLFGNNSVQGSQTVRSKNQPASITDVTSALPPSSPGLKKLVKLLGDPRRCDRQRGLHGTDRRRPPGRRAARGGHPPAHIDFIGSRPSSPSR